MQHVSKFELAEQERVVGLTPQDFPVPLLPVQSGFQCQEEGCLHLCATEKRMKSHWLTGHGRRGQPNINWQPVPLQTFFKGNLLRYFTGTPSVTETEKSVSTLESGPKDREVRSRSHFFCQRFANTASQDDLEPNAAVNPPLSPISAIQFSSLLDSSNNPLLHHYIASTSLSISTDNEMRMMVRKPFNYGIPLSCLF